MNSLNIIVTGAAGFIGSCMVQFLNEQGFENLILVDDFTVKFEEKRKNWEEKKIKCIVERDTLFEWLDLKNQKIDFIIHLGARTDTTEFDYEVHRILNYNYSIDIWNYCTQNKIPLIYASSAATYGNGSFGYIDNNQIVDLLQPLNPYGVSKNEFDKWALQQSNQPPFWTGLKLFNVYGPNEYHKNRMASVIWSSFNQIKKDGLVKLFKSNKENMKDGKLLRDFVYVKDVASVIFWMMNCMIINIEWKKEKNGLYNVGTGMARTFEDLVISTFDALDLKPNIEYIDMPLDMRDTYQYFTEANMQKLIEAGYTKLFYSLEQGVTDYVKNYLVNLKIY